MSLLWRLPRRLGLALLGPDEEEVPEQPDGERAGSSVISGLELEEVAAPGGVEERRGGCHRDPLDRNRLRSDTLVPAFSFSGTQRAAAPPPAAGHRKRPAVPGGRYPARGPGLAGPTLAPSSPVTVARRGGRGGRGREGRGAEGRRGGGAGPARRQARERPNDSRLPAGITPSVPRYGGTRHGATQRTTTRGSATTSAFSTSSCRVCWRAGCSWRTTSSTSRARCATSFSQFRVTPRC